MPLPSASERRLVLFIAASYACGFLLTNAAIAVAAPSLVETFKAAEPLSTVGLAAAFLSERERPATYAALLPIVGGVAIASSSRATFSAAGMALSLASNVSFSGRAVLTKALKQRFPASAASSSDAQLFSQVSRWGVCLLLPFALLLEMSTLTHALAGGPNVAPMAASDTDGDGGLLLNHQDTGSALLRAHDSTFRVSRDVVISDTLVVGQGATDVPPPFPPPSISDTLGYGRPPGPPAGLSHAALLQLLLWLLVNGCAHATYNGVSFAVLGRVSVATHAVLNIVRRIVCIAVAATLFGTPVTLWNWLGVLVAGAGVVAFAQSKERTSSDGRRKGLLPSFLEPHAAGKLRAV